MPTKSVSSSTRLKELKTLIKAADQAYYQESDPVMTDIEYDELIKELKSIEKANPGLITPDSPSHRIGETLTDGFTQHRHLYPMLSIDNVYSYEDLEAWYQNLFREEELGSAHNYAVIIQPKIDGIAVSLTYDKGKFVRGTTRGDGEIGDDITANCRAVLNIPMSIEHKELIEVRGECYITHADFDRVKANENSEHKNPRNLVNGTMKSHDPSHVRNRFVRFLGHSIGHLGIDSKCDNLNYIFNSLKKSGMDIAHWVRTKGFSEFKSLIDGFVSGAHNNGIPVDGIVVKLDNIDLQTSLGHGSKYVKWAIAYKHRKEYAETTVSEIVWTVGKGGKLTPVVTLEPVELMGTTITHASVHNHSEIHRLQIEEGCTVRLEKAGEIIPQIVARVNTRQKNFDLKDCLPKSCPICEGPIELVGPNLFCRNESCSGQSQAVLRHFVSKAGLDIKGIGDTLVEQLSLWVKLPEDLYTKWGEYADIYFDINHEKSKENLRNGLAAAKNCGMEKFLRSLGIPRLGKTISKELALRYRSVDDLCKNVTIDNLKEIEHVGDTIAELLYPVLSSPAFQDRICVFKDHGFNLNSLSYGGIKEVKDNEITKTKKESKLADKSICVTGSVEGYTRTQLEEKFLELGASFSSSVTKSTDILVIGDEPGSSKIEKAKKQGTPTISADELLKIFNTN